MPETAKAARYLLHQHPELSGQEQHTAARIIKWLTAVNPDQILTGLGGHGVAAVFGAENAGPKILLRCELDGLPIQETNTFEYRSQQSGVAHKCGHDGHMAILLEVARRLQQKPVKTAQVILLFQPAEETGAGAAAVCSDPQYQALQPDYAFALHNMPGYPLGSVMLREGTMNCASRGVIISLQGKTAHAAQPEAGHSPAPAMTSLIDAMAGYADQFGPTELALATVVGARLGAKAFGTAPADAEIYLTLRSETDTTMQAMLDDIEQRLKLQCRQHQLTYTMDYQDVFPTVCNTQTGAGIVADAASSSGTELIRLSRPIRWSEDFGHIIAGRDGALFGLGAGEQQAALHNPDYDFPDELIGYGADMFIDIVKQCMVN